MMKRYKTMVSQGLRCCAAVSVCVALSFLSCAEQALVSESVVAVSLDSEQERIADTTLFSSMREVRLESAPDCAINDIDKVLMADSTLYIMDRRQNKVLLFGLDGRHQGTIADIGRGRGEYIDLIDVAVDRYRRELLLLVYPKGIMHYTLDGKFKHKDELDGSFINICCDSAYYYLRRETFANKEEARHSLMSVNKETGEQRNLLSLGSERAPFCNMGGDDRLYDCGGRLFFTRYFDNNIYELADGGATALYSVDLGSYAFPESELKERFDCSELYLGAIKRNRIYAMTKLKVGRRYALMSSNLDNIVVFDTHTGRSFFTPSQLDRIYSTAIGLPCDYLPVSGTADKVSLVFPASAFTSVARINAEHPKAMRKHTLELVASFSEEDNPLLLICTLK